MRYKQWRRKEQRTQRYHQRAQPVNKAHACFVRDARIGCDSLFTSFLVGVSVSRRKQLAISDMIDVLRADRNHRRRGERRSCARKKRTTRETAGILRIPTSSFFDRDSGTFIGQRTEGESTKKSGERRNEE